MILSDNIFTQRTVMSPKTCFLLQRQQVKDVLMEP